MDLCLGDGITKVYLKRDIGSIWNQKLFKTGFVAIHRGHKPPTPEGVVAYIKEVVDELNQ